MMPPLRVNCELTKAGQWCACFCVVFVRNGRKGTCPDQFLGPAFIFAKENQRQILSLTASSYLTVAVRCPIAHQNVEIWPKWETVHYIIIWQVSNPDGGRKWLFIEKKKPLSVLGVVHPRPKFGPASTGFNQERWYWQGQLLHQGTSIIVGRVALYTR